MSVLETEPFDPRPTKIVFLLMLFIGGFFSFVPMMFILNRNLLSQRLPTPSANNGATKANATITVSVNVNFLMKYPPQKLVAKRVGRLFFQLHLKTLKLYH